jgi:hypothetical protein
MDSKKKIKKEVELALKHLHQKIDTLKKKVDQLCETTNGCEPNGVVSKANEK